jgi:hypothetical protein
MTLIGPHPDGSRHSVENMRWHVEQLCRRYQLAWYRDVKRPHRSYSLREAEEIHTTPIRSAISYATALHEVGHCVGRHQQSRRVMVRERWAWQWARAHALFWTPAMERSAASALAWYEPRAANIDRKWLPPEICYDSR